MVPRFSPVVDEHGATTLVLPSGPRATLSGAVTQTIRGLAASFAGSVSPTDSQTCCSAGFGIYHASPSDLFETLGADALSSPVAVAPAQAKYGELRQYLGRLSVQSTGEWTLVASVNNAPELTDKNFLRRFRSWRLRATPDGAVLDVPAGNTIDSSSVVLGRTPDVTDRQVELTWGEPCLTRPSTKRSVIDDDYTTVGFWCEHGVLVRVEGPPSYVRAAVANLKVEVEPNAT
jgi:hypothetical protein